MGFTTGLSTPSASGRKDYDELFKAGPNASNDEALLAHSSQMEMGRTCSSRDTRPLLWSHHYPYLIFYLVYVIPKLESSWVLGRSSCRLVSYRPPRTLARSMSFVWLNSCTLILMMHKPFAYSRKNKSSKYNGHFDGILCILINLDCYALYLGNEECNLFCST